MNLTCTRKRVQFGATSDLNFFEAKNWATWRQWVNTKEWLSSIDSGPRANFNMPVSFHKHISSEKSTLMIGLGLYKFGCQSVPVSSRPLYLKYFRIVAKPDNLVTTFGLPYFTGCKSTPVIGRPRIRRSQFCVLKFSPKKALLTTPFY